MLEKYLLQLDKYQKIIKNPYQKIRKTNKEANISIILSLYEQLDKSILVLLPSIQESQYYYDEISKINNEIVLFYQADELVTQEMFISSIEFKLERLNTIEKSLTNNKYIIISNTTGFIKKQLNKNKWLNSILNLEVNKEYNPQEIINNIYSFGYKNTYQVEKPGEYSHRGSIIDIFPLLDDKPYRLDFFGDNLDEIKIFDPKTQKSINKVDNLIIKPITELFINDEEINNIIPILKEIDPNIDIEDFKNRNNLDYYAKYIPYIDNNSQTIKDFFDNYLVVIDKYNILKTYDKIIKDLYEYKNKESNYFLNIKEYLNNTNKYLEIEGLVNIDSNLNFNVNNTLNFESNFPQLLNYINNNYLTKKIIIAINNKDKIKIIKNFFLENNIYTNIVKEEIKSKLINIIEDNYYPSFELIDEKIIILNEENIFKTTKIKKQIKYKSLMNEALTLNSIEDLKVGDYIVHYDYGIGRYLGLKTMTLSNITRDYIEIEYKDRDKLYVPIEKFDSIKKYQGRENYHPILTKLGTKQWEKTKQRIKEKVDDISDRLIKLYSERQMLKGFKYSKDTEYQKELEEDFEYEETQDQLRIINQVKNDMESSKPMDRLICGDVGYGKTEIALRASFKAIMDGKQVAYLAPTTILTRQHYQTFFNRFNKYGAKVALLNRFIKPKQEKDILKDLENGKIDMLIGTHRILSNDIKFKDLGLLIIDEEQRFGVKDKERIKEMKTNVDCITLSATPIPRTLQMSLVGIKDLSLLETPPKNRYPIQTYIVERHDSIIKEAIEKELARNGQVFYLYNKVQDIDEIASHIKTLVPEANVVYIHGQMNKNDIEDVIDKFINHEYNVLVCTTIIETGIDIPNTNTLIVHDADLLGLSQLYQIRGRVGRSDRIAFAYLMFKKNKILTQTAKQRLEVIKEFTELGSGFKIAMRDLNIRGAGDILGAEQSGFIDSVGLDLYMEILNETIKEKQGIKEDNKENKELGNILFDRTINKDYIDNDDIRIKIHQRIDDLKSTKELNDLKLELIDRFGSVSTKLEDYMYEKVFKNICNEIGIIDIYSDIRILEISFSKEKSDTLKADYLFKEASKISRNLNFKYQYKMIKINIDKNRDENYIKTFVKYLETIKDNI